MTVFDPTLTLAERKQVAATWLDRARSEEIAALRFRRLEVDLKALGTHSKVLELAQNAVGEEEEHVIICQQMAERYGADHAHKADPQHAKALAPDTLGREDALLFEMVAYCCLTESLNAALLLEITQKAMNPEIRSATQTILKDEVHHSQMGWAHLSWCRAQGKGAFIAEALPYMLSQTGAKELGLHETHLLESPDLLAHGELPLQDRKNLFHRVIHQIFFPGLVHAKIAPDRGLAWMEQNFTV